MCARRSRTTDSRSPREANDLEALLESVRSMWTEAQRAEPPVRDWVTKKITEDILRLKQQVQGKIRLATLSLPRQQTLFQPKRPEPAAKPQKQKMVDPPAEGGPRFPEPVLRVYAKDLATQALQQLPKVAECKSIDELRKHLIDNLRFNSQATRRRNANYLIGRFFPGDVLNTDLPQFAAATSGTPALGEALFYLTCRIEKLVALAAEHLVFPSLAVGGIARNKIRDFIQRSCPVPSRPNRLELPSSTRTTPSALEGPLVLAWIYRFGRGAWRHSPTSSTWNSQSRACTRLRGCSMAPCTNGCFGTSSGWFVNYTICVRQVYCPRSVRLTDFVNSPRSSP